MGERVAFTTEIDGALATTASVPYNSVANIYRAAGADWNSREYGDNCYGQLKSFSEILPAGMDCSFINNKGKNPHVAAIVDGCYADPFLSQKTPIRLSGLTNGIPQTVQTYAQGQEIEATRIDKNLSVRLLQSFPGSDRRPLLSYSYDLDQVLNSFPEEPKIVAPAEQCQFIFITIDGYAIRLQFVEKKREIRPFMFKQDAERVAKNISKYTEDCLRSQFGLTFGKLVACFECGRKIEKLLIQ